MDDAWEDRSTIPRRAPPPVARVTVHSSRGNLVPLELLRRQVDAPRECYVEQLRRAPGLEGAVLVRFTSARTHRVEDLEITPMTAEAAPLVPCAARLVARGFPSNCKGGPRIPAAVELRFVVTSQGAAGVRAR